MKAIDFLNRFTDAKIPAFVRLIAHRAVDELNNGNDTPIEVTEDEFKILVRYANITPNKTGDNLWFRIFDNESNGKDIQTFNAWKK